MTTENNPTAAAGAGAIPWLDDLRKQIERFQVPGVDVGALIEWQRRDMEAVAEANRQAYEGVKALVERRNAILQETATQWQAALNDPARADAASKQAEAARQGVEKAIADFRELSELEAKVSTNAWKVLQDRMQENLSNLQKLLQPK
jgi:phasin family protein